MCSRVTRLSAVRFGKVRKGSERFGKVRAMHEVSREREANFSNFFFSHDYTLVTIRGFRLANRISMDDGP